MGMKENAHGMNFEPYPVSTRRPVDGPSRFPKGPNVRNLRGPSEDSQWTDTKVDELMKKLCFRSKSLVLHIYSCFLQEREIFKNYKLRDAVAGRPGDQMVGRSTDVRRTLVINFF